MSSSWLVASTCHPVPVVMAGGGGGMSAAEQHAWHATRKLASVNGSLDVGMTDWNTQPQCSYPLVCASLSGAYVVQGRCTVVGVSAGVD
jgi:hypothetical protein